MKGNLDELEIAREVVEAQDVVAIGDLVMNEAEALAVPGRRGGARIRVLRVGHPRPVLGHAQPHSRGGGTAAGGELQLRAYRKGLAVRSRTELLYSIPRKMSRFMATI